MVSNGIPVVEFAAVRRGLDAMSGGDPDVLGEVLGLLIASLRRSSTTLVAAVDAGRPRQVVQAAHALRGTSLTSGLMSIAGLAEDIELGQVQGDALRGAATRLRDLVEHAIAVMRGGANRTVV
jgi:HPt (histidine-containing phosphotransfer) domain-containing protein